MIRSGLRKLARSFNLCYRYTDDLIVFNNKKFLDHLKEIYPSQLNVDQANKSDHLADYLDLTFLIDSGGKLSTRLYDKVMILTSTLSIFHFFPAIYHLALLMVCDGFRYRHRYLVDRLLLEDYMALRLEWSFKNSMADIRISLINTSGQSR